MPQLMFCLGCVNVVLRSFKYNLLPHLDHDPRVGVQEPSRPYTLHPPSLFKN